MARKKPSKPIEACAGEAFDKLARALVQVPKAELEQQQKNYKRRRARKKRKQ